ncbi:MAG: lipopolysaccharide biosynthesis protein [Acidobacteria bacterium]|nr:lipopolysaccharide biosynthesis protein [Acidobacteriota bacterium]
MTPDRTLPATPTSSAHLMRRMLVSTAFYAFSFVLQRALSVLFLPIYTHYLSPADYGVLELLDTLATVISMVLLVARFSAALNYFYHVAPDSGARDRYIGTALAAGVAGSAAVFAAVFSASAQISSFLFQTAQFSGAVQVFSVGLIATVPIEIGMAYLQITDRAGLLSSVALIRVLANAGLNVLLLGPFHMGLSAMLWGSTICALATAAFLSVKVVREVPFSFSPFALRQMLVFSAPFAISVVAEFILNFGDRVFLKSRISLADLGLYGIGYKLGMIIASFAACFLSYWDAQVVAIGRRPDGLSLIGRVATYFFAGMGLITLALALFARPALRLLASPEFFRAHEYVPWLALAYFLRAVSGFFLGVFLLGGRPGYVAVLRWAGVSVCLLGYIFLIPPFGAWGAVAATVSAFALMIPLGWWLSQRVRNISYDYTRIAKAALAMGCGWLIFNLFRPVSLTGEALGGLAALLVTAVVLLATRFISRAELDAILALRHSSPPSPTAS